MNGYLNWMIALLVLVSGLIACVQGDPEPCINVPQVERCARTCFLVAERSNGCEEKDWECKCKPFKAPVINSVDEACILKECGTQKAAQAQSALSTVCNCPRPRPTKVPEITFPDSESAEDPPPTTTAEPSMTTAESPTPSSEKHRHPHLHRLTEKIPLFNAAKMAMKGIFHHSS